MECSARFLLDWFVILSVIFSLSGCAATAGQNHPDQNAAGGSSALEKILTDVATAAIGAQADQALGKTRGEIEHIQMLQKTPNSYLLQVSYNDVKLPQGVTIIAEAYGTNGKLEQYISIPAPVNHDRGQVQILLYKQANANQSSVNNIFVKMIRNNNPNQWIAASSYLPNSHFQSEAVKAVPPVPPPPPPAVVSTVTNQAFCNQYAETAAQQFYQAQQHHCAGLVFPAWHDNKMLHFSWCMGMQRKTVEAETNRRNNYLQTCGSN